MIIRNIEIKLEPCVGFNQIGLTMSIEIADEDKLCYEEILKLDDMRSNFDRYFDFMFRHLREIIRKELSKKKEK